MKKKKLLNNELIWILYLSILSTLAYIVSRQIIYFIIDYPWHEKILAAFLLLAELFIIIHAVGYVIEIIRVIKKGKIYTPREEEIKIQTPLLSHKILKNEPFVAVVIPAFDEPLEILEKTLSSCYTLSYPNKYIFLLDDTRYEKNMPKLKAYKKELENLCQKENVALFRRSWRGAKAGILNDFLSFIKNGPQKGFVCKFMPENFIKNKPEYLAVFDADQTPFIDFLEPLIEYMKKKPKTAFIQTPQYYTNFDNNKVAKASGLQQAVFYEYICEGKSLVDATISCGTNIMYRIEALHDVGGFDEESITEDFATSFKFHIKGWHSHYFGRVGAFGMGPEDLGSYFKQQYRWAAGTIATFKTTCKTFFKNPKALSLVKWWEYFLSGTYYFMGFAFFILLACPVLFLFFSVPSYFANPWVYGLIFAPYLMFGLTSFFMTLYHRGYKNKDLFLGQILIIFAFPVFIKGALSGLSSKQKKFVITPKSGSNKIPYLDLWPQLVTGLIVLEAIFWGINRLYYEGHLLIAIGINVFWCLYNLIIMGTAFYFNNPTVEEALDKDIKSLDKTIFQEIKEETASKNELRNLHKTRKKTKLKLNRKRIKKLFGGT